MPTTDEMATTMITAKTIPLNPGVLDYEDAHGKVVLFVRDEQEGRSMYMGLELYGMIDRLFEVKYSDWEDVAVRTIAAVYLHDSKNDPLNELLGDSE